jgi:hypothetical protein
MTDIGDVTCCCSIKGCISGLWIKRGRVLGPLGIRDSTALALARALGGGALRLGVCWHFLDDTSARHVYKSVMATSFLETALYSE